MIWKRSQSVDGQCKSRAEELDNEKNILDGGELCLWKLESCDKSQENKTALSSKKHVQAI